MKLKILVGSTGFVGGNLLREMQFDLAVHRTDIEKAYGLHPNLLIYAGLPAAKFLANKAPEQDKQAVLAAEKNIKKISPKQLVFISTVDVLGKETAGRDEDTVIDEEQLEPYGRNRYELETWVRENFPEALIVRLPALFGKGLKKNFLYDFLHPVPRLLTEKKFLELFEQEPRLQAFYVKQDNGFYKNSKKNEELLQILQQVNFSALNFTDSRNQYQFYPLSRLASDIQIALKNQIKLLHLATEPLTASEIYTVLTGKKWNNKLSGEPAIYDFRSKYAHMFGGKNGYLLMKQDVLHSIQNFVAKEKIK